MNPAIQSQLQAEALRRFGGQAASNVGMRPNPSASSPAAGTPPGQPNTLMPTAGLGAPQAPAMPSQGDPFAGGAQAMNGSMPMKGGTALEKSLTKRMMMYPPA